MHTGGRQRRYPPWTDTEPVENKERDRLGLPGELPLETRGRVGVRVDYESGYGTGPRGPYLSLGGEVGEWESIDSRTHPPFRSVIALYGHEYHVTCHLKPSSFSLWE